MKVIFIQADGDVRAVNAICGSSLMEAAVAHDIAGIDAVCGGSCSCGTCHIYISPEWLEVVGATGRDEAMMLDSFMSLQANSRLACQVKISEQCEGMLVTVAPKEA